MQIKIKDIAKLTCMSEATVSLALNNSPLVNDKTRKYIKKIAKEAGYVPNPYAKKLALRKSGMLGLVIPDIENVYYAALVDHLNRITRKTGFGLSIAISENSPELESIILKEMAANRVEGLFIAPVNVQNEKPDYFSKLQAAGIPFVFTTSKYPEINAPCIMCDIENGMYELVRYLDTRGYKEIVCVSGPHGVYTLELREKGFHRAFPKGLYINRPEVTYEQGAEAALQILQFKEKIDAVVCVNDMMALGLLNTFDRLGIDIPAEIAVCGFDNVIFSMASPIPLTTVAQDIKTIAMHSVELLLQMIHSTEISNIPADVILPTNLIVRASTR